MKFLSKSLLVSLAFLTLLSSAQASELLASGEFSGRSDHETTGGFSILKTGGQTLLVLEEEFSLDGAPDPKIGFGNNGFVNSTLFTELENKDGAQVYVIPANIDISNFNEVYIWCERFDIPLGVANYSS